MNANRLATPRHNENPNEKAPNGAAARMVLAIVCLSVMQVEGCSLELPTSQRKVRLIGIGHTRPLNTLDGQIYEIEAPGISLRLHSYAPGVSIGWHRTRLFFPKTEQTNYSPSLPVAIENECKGFELAPFQLMVGFERSFQVPFPANGDNVLQSITYSAPEPTDTIVQQKTFK